MNTLCFDAAECVQSIHGTTSSSHPRQVVGELRSSTRLKRPQPTGVTKMSKRRDPLDGSVRDVNEATVTMHMQRTSSAGRWLVPDPRGSGIERGSRRCRSRLCPRHQQTVHRPGRVRRVHCLLLTSQHHLSHTSQLCAHDRQRDCEVFLISWAPRDPCTSSGERSTPAACLFATPLSGQNNTQLGPNRLQHHPQRPANDPERLARLSGQCDITARGREVLWATMDDIPGVCPYETHSCDAFHQLERDARVAAELGQVSGP